MSGDEARDLTESVGRLTETLGALEAALGRQHEAAKEAPWDPEIAALKSELATVREELADAAEKIPDGERLEKLEKHLEALGAERLPKWLRFLALAAQIGVLAFLTLQVTYQKGALDQQVDEMLIVRRFELLKSIYECEEGEEPTIEASSPSPRPVTNPCRPIANPRSRAEAVKSFVLLQRDSGVLPDLSRADFSSLNLRGADLRGADLRGVDLTGGDVRRADLRGTNLRGSWLAQAALACTDLRGADLRATDGLEEARLDKAILDATTLLPTTLQDRISAGQWQPARWLEDAQHPPENCRQPDNPSGLGENSPEWR